MYQEDELRKLLSRLRETLAGARLLSPNARRALGDMADDIDKTLQRPSEQREPQHTEHRHRLAELASHFEADHPDIAGAMRQIMDVLGKSGI
jgi:DNA-binding SARP family transcriptional activator